MFAPRQLSISEHGAQRRIHVQLIVNKRRLKRGRKPKIKSVLNLHDRVAYIFKNGAIQDYTHPKEVDPFWGTLYKQYEYLTYVDMMYRDSLKTTPHPISLDVIKDIVKQLGYIRQYKETLLRYMLNFLNVMYGAVIQSRFYGWKFYIDEFISKFNEVAIVALKKLRFDSAQTMCSVYFYQAFWLSGLAVINKISLSLNNQYDDAIQVLSNNCKVHPESEYEALLENGTSDQFEKMSDNKGVPLNSEQIEEAEVGVCEDTLHDEASYTNNDVVDSDSEIMCCLKKIMHCLGMALNELYNLSDKDIRSVGRKIKREIQKGSIMLSTYERGLINDMFQKKVATDSTF